MSVLSLRVFKARFGAVVQWKLSLPVLQYFKVHSGILNKFERQSGAPAWG